MNRRTLLVFMTVLVGGLWFSLGHFLNWKLGYEVPLLGLLGVDLLPYSGLIVGLFAVFMYYWLSKGETKN